MTRTQWLEMATVNNHWQMLRWGTTRAKLLEKWCVERYGKPKAVKSKK